MIRVKFLTTDSVIEEFLRVLGMRIDHIATLAPTSAALYRAMILNALYAWLRAQNWPGKPKALIDESDESQC